MNNNNQYARSNEFPRTDSAVDVNQQPGLATVAAVAHPERHQEEYNSHVLQQVRQVSEFLILFEISKFNSYQELPIQLPPTYLQPRHTLHKIAVKKKKKKKRVFWVILVN